MWDDDSGITHYPTGGQWVMAGGDTVIIRGCAAGPNQVNPSNPNCRIGFDRPTGGAPNNWCYYVDGGSYACYNPPIPAGTAAQHTRILGQCVLAGNCNTGNVTNRSNLTQLFGGFSVGSTLNLGSTQYVDVEGIELTTHNGLCSHHGVPNYPRGCATSPPLDDYADNGILTNNTTANILLQDLYIHGFESTGLYGPIGGPVTMTRVNVSFNMMAAWNFDDGHATPNAPGSSISAHYVTMIGNGCKEQYPIVNATFSASACYDDNSGGFGDAWSGQDSGMDSFVCDHCVMAYNTKDAFIGPHTQIASLTITNSQSYGNMGAQWKWTNAPGGTVTFENNLTVGNCARFQAPIPGAAHSFALSSRLPGAYLSDYCRAAGSAVSISSQQNSHVLFANNTFVGASATVININCGPNGPSNGMCATTPFVFTNNIFLGYTFTGGEAPGLFYFGDSSIKVTSSNSIEYGNRNGDACGAHGIICSDPLLVNEPGQNMSRGNQTFLDNFTFHPRSNSPASGRGVPIKEVTTDFFGKARPNPPSIGAVEPAASK
jgi:hypothetical protein